MEIWKDIENYEGLYQVSNLGKVKSLPKLRNSLETGEIFLKPTKTQKGYLTVRLYKNTIAKDFPVHRLVALMFVENPENKPQVNHKNGIKDHNTWENLEWVTGSENVRHAWLSGINKSVKGSASPHSKLTEEKVLEIRHKYSLGGSKMRDIAKEYSVDFALVQRVIRGKSWVHVK